MSTASMGARRLRRTAFSTAKTEPMTPSNTQSELLDPVTDTDGHFAGVGHGLDQDAAVAGAHPDLWPPPPRAEHEPGDKDRQVHGEDLLPFTGPHNDPGGAERDQYRDQVHRRLQVDDG